MSSARLVIFMLFLTTCYGIICVDETQLQLSTSEVALDNIETILDDLKTSNSMKCQVSMEFDSIAQTLTIQFGQSVEFPRLRSVENTYIHIVTSIISANPEKKMQESSIKTIIHLVCYSNNGCDRQLVIEHVSWLITTNYKNLEATIRPLIRVQGGKKRLEQCAIDLYLNDKDFFALSNLINRLNVSTFPLGECTIGNENNVEPCYDTACSWYHSMDTKKSEGKCENTDSHTLPRLDLTTEIRLFEKHKKQEDKKTKPVRAIFQHDSSMKFWCELNNCNNQYIGKLVKEAVSKQNDSWAIDKLHETNRK